MVSLAEIEERIRKIEDSIVNLTDLIDRIVFCIERQREMIQVLESKIEGSDLLEVSGEQNEVIPGYV